MFVTIYVLISPLCNSPSKQLYPYLLAKNTIFAVVYPCSCFNYSYCSLTPKIASDVHSINSSYPESLFPLLFL